MNRELYKNDIDTNTNTEEKGAASKKVAEARENAENKKLVFDHVDEIEGKKINVEHPVNVVAISSKLSSYIASRINGFQANAYSEQSETGRVRVHLQIEFVNQIGNDKKVVAEHFELPRRALTGKHDIEKEIGDFILDIPGGDKTILDGVALCLIELVPYFDGSRVMASDRMTAEEAHSRIIREVERRKTLCPADYKFDKINGEDVVCIFGKHQFKDVVKAACDNDWKAMELLRTLKMGFYSSINNFTGSLLMISDRREYTRELSDHRYYYVIKKRI